MNPELTVGDIAAWWRVDPQSVRRWIRTGSLAARKGGRDYLVTRAGLIDHLAANTKSSDDHQESGMTAAVTGLPDLYTFEEISEKYGFPLRGMKEDARAGKFPHIHRGHVWRMRPEHLEVFLAMATHSGEPAGDPLADVRARHVRKATAPSPRRKRPAA